LNFVAENAADERGLARIRERHDDVADRHAAQLPEAFRFARLRRPRSMPD
jgi:hypothetical protein